MPTTIVFQRSGGNMEQVNVEFDVDSLPANEAQELTHLLAESGFFRLPVNSGEGAGLLAEAQYTIGVEAGQGAKHTVHASESTAPESLRPLIDALSKLVEISLQGSAERGR